jgi:hypothetical protein
MMVTTFIRILSCLRLVLTVLPTLLTTSNALPRLALPLFLPRLACRSLWTTLGVRGWLGTLSGLLLLLLLLLSAVEDTP